MQDSEMKGFPRENINMVKNLKDMVICKLLHNSMGIPSHNSR